ncbi:Pentatricopeptide repeat-containing protein [Acorus calamus]|uniref:Pentatricopeptide repeat-containing protein n=1 Tax=Acorus calamus TaxID=4465 RepID=A0AAV9F5Y6_ACOCL|nr:Pentatricopeptide repeat-containing protein [Acorus calamus]
MYCTGWEGETQNFLSQIHANLIISGATSDDLSLACLVISYSSLRGPDIARSVFDSSPNPTSPVLWNSIIRAYTRARRHSEALAIYHSMSDRNLAPDKHTFTFVLKACTGASDSQLGLSIHRQIKRRGLESDVFIGTALVDMYCKLGRIRTAREVFDRMPVKDVVAWNALIAGLEALREGMALHAHAVKIGFESSYLVGNSLIDVYSKCGRLDFAERLFDWMLERDTVSWNAMLNGYAIHGRGEEAVSLFSRMM